MKLLHTSDWHLGRMIFGRSLLPDQEAFLKDVFLPAAKEERPDCILLAGDIFDRQIAPVEAIRLFDYVIAEIHKLKIPLAVIAGNHDGADRIAIGAPLLRQSGIFIAARLEDAFLPLTVQAGDETADIYLLPYCEPAMVRQFLHNDDIHGFQDAYAAILDEIKKTFRPNVLHILVSHCFVAGGKISDSESPVYVGGSGEVNPAVFDGFDYVALGHLHAPQRAGEHGRYSGSPLKYSFDEEHQRKSLTMLEIGMQDFQIRELPVKPLHDMRTISGTMMELLTREPQETDKDYLFIRVTDKNPVYMPAEQLRTRYPNLLSVSCDWLNPAEAAGGDSVLREQLLHRKIDEMTVFEQFMKQICGAEMDENDRALFLQALNEVKTSELE